MWLSMDAVLVMSVSIIFDYHVSLNLANILHDFVSHDEAHRYYYILFKVFRIIDLFPYKLDSHYHVVVHGNITCFVSVHYFDYHVSLNLANILHNFCVSQWGSSIVLPTFQGISQNWLISLQIGVTLPCGCPWKQYLFRQCPLFSIIMCP